MQSLAAILSLTTSVSSNTVGAAELRAFPRVFVLVDSASVASFRGVWASAIGDKTRMMWWSGHNASWSHD